MDYGAEACPGAQSLGVAGEAGGMDDEGSEIGGHDERQQAHDGLSLHDDAEGENALAHEKVA